MSIAEAQAFDEFQLYWFGESFAGLPVTGITRYLRTPAPELEGYDLNRNSVGFSYGSCWADPNEEGGCAIPMSMSVEPTCAVYNDLVAPMTPDRLSTTGDSVTLRGVPAAILDETTIVAWTGTVTIKIHLPDDLSVSPQDAVNALTRFPDTGTDGQANLPPADFSSCP
jgi:hypothetical protein